MKQFISFLALLGIVAAHPFFAQDVPAVLRPRGGVLTEALWRLTTERFGRKPEATQRSPLLAELQFPLDLGPRDPAAMIPEVQRLLEQITQNRIDGITVEDVNRNPLRVRIRIEERGTASAEEVFDAIDTAVRTRDPAISNFVAKARGRVATEHTDPVTSYGLTSTVPPTRPLHADSRQHSTSLDKNSTPTTPLTSASTQFDTRSAQNHASYAPLNPVASHNDVPSYDATSNAFALAQLHNQVTPSSSQSTATDVPDLTPKSSPVTSLPTRETAPGSQKTTRENNLDVTKLTGAAQAVNVDLTAITSQEPNVALPAPLNQTPGNQRHDPQKVNPSSSGLPANENGDTLLHPISSSLQNALPSSGLGAGLLGPFVGANSPFSTSNLLASYAYASSNDGKEARSSFTGGQNVGTPLLGEPNFGSQSFGGRNAGTPQNNQQDAGVPFTGGQDVGARLVGGQDIGAFIFGGKNAGAPFVGGQNIGTQPSGQHDAGAPFVGGQNIGTQPSSQKDAGAPFVGGQNVGTQPSSQQAAGASLIGGQNVGTQPSSQQGAGAPFIGGQNIGTQPSGQRDVGAPFVGGQNVGTQPSSQQDAGAPFLGGQNVGTQPSSQQAAGASLIGGQNVKTQPSSQQAAGASLIGGQNVGTQPSSQQAAGASLIGGRNVGTQPNSQQGAGAPFIGGQNVGTQPSGQRDVGAPFVVSQNAWTSFASGLNLGEPQPSSAGGSQPSTFSLLSRAQIDQNQGNNASPIPAPFNDVGVTSPAGDLSLTTNRNDAATSRIGNSGPPASSSHSGASGNSVSRSGNVQPSLNLNSRHSSLSTASSLTSGHSTGNADATATGLGSVASSFTFVQDKSAPPLATLSAASSELSSSVSPRASASSSISPIRHSPTPQESLPVNTPSEQKASTFIATRNDLRPSTQIGNPAGTSQLKEQPTTPRVASAQGLPSFAQPDVDESSKSHVITGSRKNRTPRPTGNNAQLSLNGDERTQMQGGIQGSRFSSILAPSTGNLDAIENQNGVGQNSDLPVLYNFLATDLLSSANDVANSPFPVEGQDQTTGNNLLTSSSQTGLASFNAGSPSLRNSAPPNDNSQTRGHNEPQSAALGPLKGISGNNVINTVGSSGYVGQGDAQTRTLPLSSLTQSNAQKAETNSQLSPASVSEEGAFLTIKGNVDRLQESIEPVLMTEQATAFPATNLVTTTTSTIRVHVPAQQQRAGLPGTNHNTTVRSVPVAPPRSIPGIGTIVRSSGASRSGGGQVYYVPVEKANAPYLMVQQPGNPNVNSFSVATITTNTSHPVNRIPPSSVSGVSAVHTQHPHRSNPSSNVSGVSVPTTPIPIGSNPSPNVSGFSVAVPNTTGSGSSQPALPASIIPNLAGQDPAVADAILQFIRQSQSTTTTTTTQTLQTAPLFILNQPLPPGIGVDDLLPYLNNTTAGNISDDLVYQALMRAAVVNGTTF